MRKWIALFCFIITAMTSPLGWSQTPLGNNGSPAGVPTSEPAPFPNTIPAPTQTPPPVVNSSPAPGGETAMPATQATPGSGISGGVSPGTTEPPISESNAEANPQSVEALVEREAMGPVTLRTTLQKNIILPITLEDVLKMALGENISIAIAERQARQQRLAYELRLSDLLPDIIGQYQQSRFVGAIQIFGNQVINISRTTTQPQVTLNYSIYTGGRNLFDIRASRQRAEAQAHLSEETRQNILKQVANTYYELQLAYLQKQIALQAIREAREELALNQARERAGVGVLIDVLQSQTFLSARQQDLISAENLISQSKERLAQLLALDFGAELQPVSLDITSRELVPHDIPVRSLLGIALMSNPRLKAMASLREAAHSDVRVAKADLFPRIDITAYTNGVGPSLDQLHNSRFAGIQASTNLLENMGFARPLQIKLARNNEDIARLNALQARQEVQENLSNSLVNIQALSDQIRTSQETLHFARETYNQAFGRMRAGVGTVVDLENAMLRLTQARTDLARAFLRFNQAEVNLVTDLGVASITTLTGGFHPMAAAVQGKP